MARINRLLLENKHTLSKSEEQVLLRLRDKFLKNAENTAFSFAPDGRTHFQHQESIASPLVEELRDEIINLLAEVGITFEKTTGMRDHNIKGLFPVVKS